MKATTLLLALPFLLTSCKLLQDPAMRSALYATGKAAVGAGVGYLNEKYGPPADRGK